MRKTLLTLLIAVTCVMSANAQVLTLRDTRDLTENINAAAESGSEYILRFSSRAVNGDMWNVLVLPFDTDVATISNAFYYVAVDILNEEVASGNVHFKTYTGKIPAYTPFLFKPTSDPKYGKKNFNEVSFSGVKLKAVPEKIEVSDAAGNKFVGTVAPTTFYGSKYWYLSKNLWYRATRYTEENPVKLKSLRAYVDYTRNTMNMAPQIIIEEPDGTTSIVSPEAFSEGQFSTDATQDDGWYTITGAPLSEKPTTQGMYIHQGRKVIVK